MDSIREVFEIPGGPFILGHPIVKTDAKTFRGDFWNTVYVWLQVQLFPERLTGNVFHLSIGDI